jgi:outer membrane biosynthesis protein TonB
MGDGELTDLVNVLLTAAGAGLALACGYLVMKPATRTMKRWLGASLVAVPGLLLGVALAHPQLGVRSAYGGLTQALLGSTSTLDEGFVVDPPAAGDRTSDEIGGSAGTQADPSLAPAAGVEFSGSPDADDPPAETAPGDPISTPPTDTPTSEPPPPTDTPTSEPPPPTDSPSPSPTESETPPPPPPPEPSPSGVSEG